MTPLNSTLGKRKGDLVFEHIAQSPTNRRSRKARSAAYEHPRRHLTEELQSSAQASKRQDHGVISRQAHRQPTQKLQSSTFQAAPRYQAFQAKQIPYQVLSPPSDHEAQQASSYPLVTLYNQQEQCLAKKAENPSQLQLRSPPTARSFPVPASEWSSATHHHPSYYDSLTVIDLTSRAVEEFNRRCDIVPLSAAQLEQ
ncbi:hypothetical protein BDR22DRAFT_889274 [Usnea florida]